jgi:hypothetical protein
VSKRRTTIFADDARVLREMLRTERAERAIREIVDQAPPLDDAARAELAVLLLSVRQPSP